MFLEGVAQASPPFELQDLRLLLRFDSVYLSTRPKERLQYLGILLDGASHLSSASEPGATSVIDEVVSRISNWQPMELGNRDLSRWGALRSKASLLGAQPLSRRAETKPVEPTDGYGIAILDLLGRIEPWPTGVASLLSHLGSARSTTPSGKWERVFSELVQAVDGPGDLIRALLELLVTAPAVPVEHYSRVESLLLYWNDDLARGLVWAAAVLDEPWVPKTLQRVAVRCLRESRGRQVRPVTVRGEKVPFACFYALIRMGSPESMAIVGQFVQTLDNRSVVRRILDMLAPVAAERDLSVDQLLERNVPDYELEEGGIRRVPIGDGLVEIRLDDRSGAVLAWTSGGGEGGPIPADIETTHADELAETKTLWDDIRKSAQAERLRIEALLAGQRRWGLDEFFESYVSHPLTGWYGRRLLWVATTPDGERIVGIPSETDRNALVTLSGSSQSLPSGSVVSIWHPSAVSEDEVDAARKFLATGGIGQPFRQAWREVYRPDELELGAQLYSDRFAAHILRHKQFYTLSRQRGWLDGYLSNTWDGGQSAHCYREFPDAGVRVVWIIAQVDWHRPEANVDLCATDRLRFEAMGEEVPVPIPISAVSGPVFSEAFRDVDLFVSTCTVANDLLWLERMAGERGVVEYWERVASDGLGTTTTLRRQALEALMVDGVLTGPFTLDDRFLVVRGSLGTYKIELATANILLDPPGKWLALKSPKPAAIADLMVGHRRPDINDDDVLDRVIVRARALADDTKIQDERFRQQIR